MTLVELNCNYPQRIVCLTEESTETLYLLGEGDRVVGISGYTVRPPEARRKPKVSAFISASFAKIYALNPDLVIAFSDLQADIVRELIRNGVQVMTFNQRSISEILQTILMTGGLIGCTGGLNSWSLSSVLLLKLLHVRQRRSLAGQKFTSKNGWTL
jgi:ABC-type Fe3+-hydroxamate transport system substrate-binding protein